MAEGRIRSAAERDLPGLVGIYNHYVAHSHITFDIQPFSIEERRSWFKSFSSSGAHRLLVAEFDSRPVGYASSGSFRAKPAYRRSVETTIYIDEEFIGQGIGRALYGALIEELEADSDIHRAYGCIALPNAGSVALHERLGFTHAGTFREVGYKFDRYWDVSWYERDVSGRNAT